MVDTSIIDEWEANWRKVIGVEMEVPVRCDASKDNILVFCDALGDNNPLWLDEEYARKSRFGMLTAPPLFLIKVSNVNTAHDLLAHPLAPQHPHPLQNLGHLQAAIDFQWLRPIWLGDKFTVRGKVTEITRKVSKAVGPSVWPVIESSYFNQHRELVAVVRQTMCLHAPTTGGAVRGGDPDQPGVVAKAADVLAAERTRRGAQPRYWEDVEVGEELTPLEKGVFSIAEGMRWQLNVHLVYRVLPGSGGTGDIRASVPTQLGLRGALERKPDIGMVSVGPSQLKYGWLGQLVTDWMGDDGALKKFAAQLRSQPLLGDIHVAKGKVTKKYVEGGEHLVDCEVFVENQAGRVIAPGWATVVLPSKEGK